MSGQATGWALRNGPKDRAMRLVLYPIADAANRDGEHSHPGLAAIIEGSLYGRAHVLATLAKLTEEGWIVIEEEGGGRGKATVYGIPGVKVGPSWEPPGKVQPVDPMGNGPIRPERPRRTAKRSNPGAETVQSEESTLSYATEDLNVGLPLAASPQEPDPDDVAADGQIVDQPDPIDAMAQRLTVLAHEQPIKPSPCGGFLAARGIIKTLLANGHRPQAVADAITAGGIVWTLAGLEVALNRTRPKASADGYANPAAAAADYIRRHTA